MKKLLPMIAAFVIVLTLLFPAVVTFAAAGAAVSLSNDLNVEGAVASNGGSLVAAAGGANTHLGDDGYAVEIKTGKNTSISRGTKLIPVDASGKTMPPGTYTISVWMRHNPASSSDWISNLANVQSELYLSFYGADATNASIQYNHQASNSYLVRLLGSGTATTPAFALTTDHTVTANADGTVTKDWYRYEASVTTTRTFSQVAFWLVNGETANAKDWYVYIDDLSISGTDSGAADEPIPANPPSGGETPSDPSGEDPQDQPLSATPAVAGEHGLVVSNPLDSLVAMEGSLISTNSGSVSITGKSLLIKTQKASYSLNGNPEEEGKYLPEKWHNSRRTKLAGFEGQYSLPAGTYTVSVWVYESGIHLGNEAVHESEILFTLHAGETTDSSLGYCHEDAKIRIALFPVSANPAGKAFAPSGKTVKVGSRTWAEYTAEITTEKEYAGFCFWLAQYGETGEALTISTYLDDLSIYDATYAQYLAASAGEDNAEALQIAKTEAKEFLDRFNNGELTEEALRLIESEKAKIDAATDTESVNAILAAAKVAVKARIDADRDAAANATQTTNAETESAPAEHSTGTEPSGTGGRGCASSVGSSAGLALALGCVAVALKKKKHK